jgi:hypothetical protein
VKPLSIAKPPKPVSDMAEAELDGWANEVYDQATKAQR